MAVVATERHAGASIGPEGPYERGFAITPSNTDELAEVVNAIHVGGAGAVAVVFAKGGASVTLAALPVGIHRIRVRQVLSTGTTATNLVGLV